MARDYLKEAQDKFDISAEEQHRRMMAAKLECETKRCRATHPDKECIAEVVGVLGMYNCMFGGRPMDHVPSDFEDTSTHSTKEGE